MFKKKHNVHIYIYICMHMYMFEYLLDYCKKFSESAGCHGLSCQVESRLDGGRKVVMAQ